MLVADQLRAQAQRRVTQLRLHVALRAHTQHRLVHDALQLRAGDGVQVALRARALVLQARPHLAEVRGTASGRSLGREVVHHAGVVRRRRLQQRALKVLRVARRRDVPPHVHHGLGHIARHRLPLALALHVAKHRPQQPAADPTIAHDEVPEQLEAHLKDGGHSLLLYPRPVEVHTHVAHHGDRELVVAPLPLHRRHELVALLCRHRVGLTLQVPRHRLSHARVQALALLLQAHVVGIAVQHLVRQLALLLAENLVDGRLERRPHSVYLAGAALRHLELGDLDGLATAAWRHRCSRTMTVTSRLGGPRPAPRTPPYTHSTLECEWRSSPEAKEGDGRAEEPPATMQHGKQAGATL
eukprot:COSAG01_NODE_1062_length_11889_cov_62.593469_9_plen_355_part_00